MGTKTLPASQPGSPGSGHFVFFSSSGVSFKAQGNPQTTSEEMYVDQINVYASTESGTRQFKHAIYGTGGSLLAQASVFHNFGSSIAATHSEFADAALFHITSGQHILAAVFCTTNLQLYGNGSGSGRSMDEHAGTSFPSPWSTSNISSAEGDMTWWLNYFPVATITSIPSDPKFPGATIDIVGRSFSAGIVSVEVDGLACTDVSVSDDNNLSAVLPANARTGPVVVTTNAGTATSATNLTVSGGRVTVGGILVPTSSARINIGGTLVDVTSIRRANASLTLEDVH